MIGWRFLGWVLLAAGLAVLLRDALVWFDVGRWVPLAVGDLRGWSTGVPEPVLLLWVGPPALVFGIAVLALCRRPPER